MGLLSGFALFFIVWWTCLFAVLPWGVRTNADDNAPIDPLIAPSAPKHPLLLRKVLATTLLAIIVWGFAVYLIVYSPLQLDDIPWLPRFDNVPYEEQ